MNREIRAGMPVEIRAASDGVRVEGHAAVYNEWADIGGMFMERFAPGAFTNAITRNDVVFLINHEGLPLARTRSGTLSLSEDDRGLVMASNLDPSDPDVAQIVPKMKRGDLDKMSIAFFATRQEWDESGDIPRRTVQEAELFDVSVVTEPAFSGTDIALRSRPAARSRRQIVRAQTLNLRARLAAR